MAIVPATHTSHSQQESTPAIAILKGECPEGKRLPRLVAQMFADKGVSSATTHYLSKRPAFLGHLIGHLLMQAPEALNRASAFHDLLDAPLPGPSYTGSLAENRKIDEAIHHSQVPTPANSMRRSTYTGAAGAYFGLGISVPHEMRDVGVLIIGSGAAGILVARALVNAGMRNVVVLEKDRQTGGIWSRDTPRRILQAIPFPLHYERLTLAPGPRPGQEITSFLETLVSPPRQFGWTPFPRILPGEVVEILPGDLWHRVIYRDQDNREREIGAPIVINAMGVGEPLVPSWSGALTTDLAPEQAEKRWQEVWSEQEAQALAGRKLGFVSLSNATLSMLWQIQALKRRGIAIDYEVITHYPAASLFEPQAHIEHRGRSFRLFRDLEHFQLLRMAGDMAPFRQAFEEARETGKITAQVVHWTLEHRGPQRFLKALLDNGEERWLHCDLLYTLIGYAPQAEILARMGLHVNHPYMGAVSQDYDAEAQREPGATGRSRIFPGYFCFGLRNGFNENEVLLPGLLYRLPNLVAGVLLRSAEYAAQYSNSSETHS